MSTRSEFAAASVTYSALMKSLLVGSIYRPPDVIIEYSSELYTAITTIGVGRFRILGGQG